MDAGCNGHDIGHNNRSYLAGLRRAPAQDSRASSAPAQDSAGAVRNKTINTMHNKLQAFLKLLEFRIVGSASR
jgi:hypothetical protein